METKNTAKERLDQVEAVLDEYEGKLGIGNYSEDFHDQSVKKYMSMPRQQMEKITVEECAEAALLLGGFSFYLQRSYNREIARVNWATSNLKKMISGREQQYSGSWDSQYYQAIKEDRYASKLDNIKTYAQQRADRLTYLATSVKNLSDLYINLQRSKINRHG
jgi:hypothetical protein